jgi:hyperosmotically inducible periplasmic protein
MKRTLATIAFGAIAASASAGAVVWTTEGSSPAVQVAGNEERPDADDSGKNVRDRDDRTLTPADQGGSPEDRAITQRIRQAVVADDGLSMNAKNVKIITVDGVVTLRGPVKTAAEKTKIASVSAEADGVKRVDNQIEVEAKD